MMGLEAWPTACRPRATLAHVAVGSVLSFTVPDAILEDVAQCGWSGVSRECAMRVSLIDVHTHWVSSRSLSVRTTHSMSYMFSSNELQYIPLEQFDVDLTRSSSCTRGRGGRPSVCTRACPICSLSR